MPDKKVAETVPEGTGDVVAAGEPGQPYQSLYRRYRPQRFADVRGQEHVTRALLNAVRDGRVSHAYLFSGPRGTGKTSTARILAMALNCEHPTDGEPDGTCPSCVSIRNGSSLDVQELDAASNRKLDEMRDLLSRVSLGIMGRWKVYIVDEVHQLTSDAASALLKTLEEPPAHVIFVLATTDPQKVLPTIRSRTQHFEFRLLGPDVLAGLLSDVNRRAALGVAPEAIDLVVRRGHGSARDALSVLDQVAAAGTVEDEMAIVADIVEALVERDAGRILVAVAEGVDAGRDPRRLAVDLLEHLRNAFLASQARGLVHLPDDAVAEAESQAHRLGLATLVRAMEVVGQATTDMRDAVDPRIALEVALVRLAAPAADVQPAAMLERIERLERQLAGASAAPTGHAPSGQISPPAPTLPTGMDASRLPGPESSLRSEPPPLPTAPPTSTDTTAAPVFPRKAQADRPATPITSRPVVGDPPPMPRPSLGAHRRAAATTSAAPSAGPAAAPAPAPAPPSETPPVAGLPTGGAVEVGTSPAGAGTPVVPPPASSVAATSTLAIPTRDELTKAWGDQILPAMPTRIKAYLALGRFVTAEDGTAVYAVPDAGLLGRAQPFRGDFEAALAAHFGRPVPVHLVLDDGSVPGGTPPTVVSTADEDDPAYYVLDEMEDVGAAVVSPEQRVLDAFPGAEEVIP
jgi:DNA polymerase-3 subunit gamma/tau